MKQYIVVRHRLVHGFDHPTPLSAHRLKVWAEQAIARNREADERRDRQGYWYTIEFRDPEDPIEYFYDPTRKS